MILFLKNLWLSNALFGNGLLHADLHPGNILIDFGGSKSNRAYITLVDFGNVGHLQKKYQCYVLFMIDKHLDILSNVKKGKVPNVRKNIASLVSSFTKLCDIKLTELEIRQLNEHLVNFYSTGNVTSFGSVLQEIIKNVTNLGGCAVGSMVEFGKGIYLLEQTWIALLSVLPGTTESPNLLEVFKTNIKKHPVTLSKFINKDISCNILY